MTTKKIYTRIKPNKNPKDGRVAYRPEYYLLGRV